MMYPLVRELAVDGVPVTVTCRGTRLLQTSVLRLAVGSGFATGLG